MNEYEAIKALISGGRTESIARQRAAQLHDAADTLETAGQCGYGYAYDIKTAAGAILAGLAEYVGDTAGGTLDGKAVDEIAAAYLAGARSMLDDPATGARDDTREALRIARNTARPILVDINR